MIFDRTTKDDLPTKVIVELAFQKQMIIRGVYTGWNVTKISYSLNEDDPWMIVLDEDLFWPGFEKENENVDKEVFSSEFEQENEDKNERNGK